MRRRSLIVAVLAGVAAAAGPLAATGVAASATPLMRVADASVLAISGDEVLVGGPSTGGGALLQAVPVTGGAAVARFQARPREGFSLRIDALDASAERAAFIIAEEGPEAAMSTAFAGPPGGPFTPVTTGSLRRPRDAIAVDVDGPRVLLVESDAEASFATVIEADGTRTQLPLPADGASARLAGDLVGIAGDTPSGLRTRIRLLDRRTGDLRRQFDWDASSDIAMRADGLVVGVGDRPDGDSTLFAATAGQPTRELAAVELARRTPEIAGDGVLAVVYEEIASAFVTRPIVLPVSAGPALPAGPATDAVGAAAISDRWVAWAAHGCVAAVSRAALPAADALGPGPCARAELLIEGAPRNARNQPRSIEIALRCLSAPPPGCDTTLRAVLASGRRSGRTVARGRITVPAGTRVRTRMALTPAGLRDVRATTRRAGTRGTDIRVIATVTAPGGPSTRVEDTGTICPGRCR